MSKYDQIPLRRIKARVAHVCLNCDKIIESGTHYYSQKDRYIQVLHSSPKEFCEECYLKYGENLLKKKPKINTIQNDEYLSKYL